MTSRLAYRISAVALLIGVVGSAIASAVLFAAVQDPFADIGATKYMNGILDARNVWLGVHLSFAFLVLFKLAGLMGLSDVLDRGPARPLARIGNGFVFCGVGLFLVTMVHDGYVHESMAAGWEADHQAAWLPVFTSGLKTTLGMEVGSIIALLGLAPITYGIAMLTGSRFPRWLGWLGVAGGAGAAVTAVVLWMTGNTSFGYSMLYPVFASLVPIVWYVGIAVVLWRRGADAAWRDATPSTAEVPEAASGGEDRLCVH